MGRDIELLVVEKRGAAPCGGTFAFRQLSGRRLNGGWLTSFALLPNLPRVEKSDLFQRQITYPPFLPSQRVLGGTLAPPHPDRESAATRSASSFVRLKGWSNLLRLPYVGIC